MPSIEVLKECEISYAFCIFNMKFELMNSMKVSNDADIYLLFSNGKIDKILNE